MLLDITIYCSKCGSKLEIINTKIIEPYGDIYVDVEPCEDCLKDAYDEGYEDGKVEG